MDGKEQGPGPQENRVSHNFRHTRKGRAPKVTREWPAAEHVPTSHLLLLSIAMGIIIALATTPGVLWSHEMLLLAMACVFWVLSGMLMGEPKRSWR
jgi:hypothetical protein